MASDSKNLPDRANSIGSVFTSVILSLVLFSASASAQSQSNEVTVRLPSLHGSDSLEPDRSALTGDPTLSEESDYAKIVIASFKEIYAPDVRVRAFISEAFVGSEEAVAVKERGDSFSVIGAKSLKWLWGYTEDSREQDAELHLPPPPQNFRSVPITRCVRSISQTLGRQLVDVWQVMLSHPQDHPFVEVPADDVWVDFSEIHDLKIRSGKIWSSYDEPNVSTLVRITFELQEFCMKGGKARSAALTSDVASLLSHLTRGTAQ